MPTDMPYPGETDEQFLARMMAQMQGGPGAPMPGPDPRLMAMQQMMGGGMPAPGTRPVEEMMGSGQHGVPGGVEEGFGGDGSMADAYGGPDPYTSGLPGATGPRTPMQNRNRRLMLSEPNETDDEFEQREMLGDYEDEIDPESQEPRYRRVDDPENRATPPVRFRGSDEVGGRVGPDGDGVPSTEDELEMVQKQINGSPRDQGEQRRMLRDHAGEEGPDYGPGNPGLSGESREDDEAFLRELMADGYENIDEIIEEFKELWGDLPEDLRDDSERDNID